VARTSANGPLGIRGPHHLRRLGRGKVQALRKVLVFKEIAARIRLFLALPLDDIDSMSIQQQLRAMGREGPT